MDAQGRLRRSRKNKGASPMGVSYAGANQCNGRRTYRIIGLRGAGCVSRASSAPWGRHTNRHQPMVTKTKLPGPFEQSWHAVSVAAGPVACPAADGLRHKRFLSDEAPPLPLPECSSPWRCKCIYRHYSDRRATRRRDTDRSRLPSPRVGKERRERLGKRGRRTDDQ